MRRAIIIRKRMTGTIQIFLDLVRSVPSCERVENIECYYTKNNNDHSSGLCICEYQRMELHDGAKSSHTLRIFGYESVGIS